MSESMSEALLQPLDDLDKLSKALFVALSPPQKPPQPPAPPAAAFLDADARLAAAVSLAHVHQLRQRRIEALKAEILSLDSRWRDVCIELEKEKRELEAIIEEGEERVKAIEEAKNGSIPYPELLQYAQSLSAFSSAPPNMPEKNIVGPPPPLFFPPFPTEDKMRRGHLNAEAPLGAPGETHSVRPPSASPTKPGDPQRGANPYRHDVPPPPQFFDFDLDLDLNPDLH
ncbi:hypothetical protein CYLTODRAFT_423049 [Cylindrobasidium torrendii FP15055 ss-10]|uniref:Mediator of RNA polymerase II transcription subunit 4 n=1 Tax=Cylindrobasidium torrendii FP15055 ss-10 TaxID=1314674 RepID=A0A0D7B8P1_9AGAR|nr:hypothetical protein CYLTODRAFT_423049 [Cylindrobasidium torrendii FP15055 ss-10]